MKWLHRFLLRFNFYQRFSAWSRSYVIPGFYPFSLHQVFAFFSRELQERTLINRASSLAFNFMLAFFPATIFLFTLIPYIPIKNFQRQLLDIISTILPYNAYLTFQETIEDIIRHHNGKLLSIGFISALYFATNGVTNLMLAFNRASLVVEKRSWLKRRGIAVSLTVMISTSLLVAITLLTAGEGMISFIQHHIQSKSHFWMYLFKTSRWVIVIIIFFVPISLLYRYGPANKRKWHFFSAGAILATVLALLTSQGFSFYINNFSSYNKIYGSIGTLIILMLWLYLNCLILLIGFELNASLDFSRRNQKKVESNINELFTKNFDNPRL